MLLYITLIIVLLDSHVDRFEYRTLSKICNINMMRTTILGVNWIQT